ncbi:MAG: glycosyltransferase family 39 protein [Pseudolabrys sp.]|nr:glycosyltransferase family 39 protein [Pseudolabrys sp.]
MFADRAAIGVLIVVAAIAALTFRDYGLGWDDYTHSQYGDLLLALYGSGFADQRALSFVNLYKYGGGFDMAAALAAKVLPFDLFETRRLTGAAVGLVGLYVTWRMGRRLGGPVAGLCALLLLAACPLFYGHMFMNPKDAPFATAMAVLLFGIVRALDEFPRPDVRTVVLAGVGLGLAFGSRILAGVAAIYAVIPLAMILIENLRIDGGRPAAQRLGGFIVTMLPALLIGYLIMGLLWPWSIVSPLNPLDAAEYFDKFFEKPWRELFLGRLISVPDMPLSYLPVLFAVKLPEIMLVLGLAGAIGAAAQRNLTINRRAALFAVTLAALLPIALAMISHPAFYNGLRHFIFLVPPFAVLGGVAMAWIIRHASVYGRPALAAAVAVFVAGLALPVIDMVRLHPYQYTSFNTAYGGVKKAQANFMLDYWGLAFKEAAHELRTRLDAAADRPPPGRRWVVAICGNQATAQVALGPAFETTYNEKQADFAMALGTYYCKYLKAPIMATVEREGVIYARVYDMRGRPPEGLLNVPPP